MMRCVLIGVLLTTLLSYPSRAQIGYVHEIVDASCNWTTYRADGTVLSTSTTLQDGINEAQSSGYPLVVDGNLNCPITGSATFGPASLQTYVLRNVLLIGTVTIDALYSTTIDWTGYIKYAGTATSVVNVAPTHVSSSQFERFPILELCRISLPFIWVKRSTVTDMVTFDPSAGAITNNTFHFADLDGGGGATNGIVVHNPPNASFAFVQNHIDFNLIVSFTSHGIQEGDGPIDPSTQPLGTNVWRGAIATSGSPYAAYQTFAVMSQAYFSSISIDGGTLQSGVFFGPGSQNNYVVSPQITATAPLVDEGRGNKLVTPAY
jgi:hypothetical protein